VHLHLQSGEVFLDRATTTALLPLRLRPLRVSLDAIARSDPWLLARSPVFYTDQHGQVHIDFPSLAGFTVDPGGAPFGRAVNPY
jgi:hypothetical protein